MLCVGSEKNDLQVLGYSTFYKTVNEKSKYKRRLPWIELLKSCSAIAFQWKAYIIISGQNKISVCPKPRLGCRTWQHAVKLEQFNMFHVMNIDRKKNLVRQFWLILICRYITAGRMIVYHSLHCQLIIYSLCPEDFLVRRTNCNSSNMYNNIYIYKTLNFLKNHKAHFIVICIWKKKILHRYVCS